MNSTNELRAEFIAKLDRLIKETNDMPRFKGQTQAIKSLRRIRTLSALRGLDSLEPRDLTTRLWGATLCNTKHTYHKREER